MNHSHGLSAMTLFVPSIAIIGIAVVVLVVAWLVGAVDGIRERRTMAAFRKSMAASVRPRLQPKSEVLPVLAIPRVDRLPILPSKPTSLPVPTAGLAIPTPPRRLRTPPPVPHRLSRLSRNDTDPDELSAVTSRYTSEQLEQLRRSSAT